MRLLFTDRWGNPIFESFTQRRLRRLFHRQSSTSLLFAVKNRNWEEVIRRCKSHPRELLLRDETTGSTPLHVACRLNPPAAVIRAMKAVSRMPNNDGATPLFFAASHRMSVESLQALLEVGRETPAPDHSKRDPTADLSNHGRAPIHRACASFRGLELDAFKLLFEETLRKGQVEIDGSDSHHFIDEDFLEDLGEEYYMSSSGSVKKTVNVLEMKDLTGQTPLGLLFRRYRERVRHVINRVDRLHRLHEPQRAALAAALTVHGDLGGLWDRARWIVARLSEERRRVDGSDAVETHDPQSPGEVAVSLEAATWAMEQFGDRPSLLLDRIAQRSMPPLRPLSTVEESVASPSSSDTEEGATSDFSAPPSSTMKPRHKFRVVHSSVGLVGYGCPSEMIRLAISIHPSQVQEMDEDGNLPIHIAATASSSMVDAPPSEDSMAHALAAAADGADDLSVLSDAAMSFFSVATVRRTTNPFDKVLKMLLQHYPEGARIPQGRSGRLPLVMAIECGHRSWDDGIRTLLNAYPPAMHKKKLIEAELYPNLLGLVVQPTLQIDGVPRSTQGAVSSSPTKTRINTAAKSTLFDLLRAKPDWLTKGFEDKKAAGYQS